MANMNGDSITLDNDEKRIWLRSISDSLLDPSCRAVYEGAYENCKQVRGYSFCLRLPQPAGDDQFIMISRHNSTSRPPVNQIASELLSLDCVMRDGDYGFYYNRSHAKGQYASVKCGNRWYMISQAGVMEPRHIYCFPGLSHVRYRMSNRRRALLWG